MNKFGWVGAAAAALMVGASMAMPSMGQRYTPRFERSAPDYNGDGKKVRAKTHPRHNARKFSRDWMAYRAKVMSTHRDLPDGRRQTDPRDDKYLHSHARGMRVLVKALDDRSRFAA